MNSPNTAPNEENGETKILLPVCKAPKTFAPISIAKKPNITIGIILYTGSFSLFNKYPNIKISSKSPAKIKNAYQLIQNHLLKNQTPRITRCFCINYNKPNIAEQSEQLSDTYAQVNESTKNANIQNMK